MSPYHNRSYTMGKPEQSTAERAEAATNCVLRVSAVKPFRLLPGAAENVRRARAFAWDRASALGADGSARADPRAHTFLGRGKHRLAIRDRKCELCWKLVWQAYAAIDS